MNIKSVTPAFALFALALASCSDKNAFIVSGEVQNPNNIQKVYLLQTDSTVVNVIDSAQLSDRHQFSFKHESPYAALYKLKVGNAMFDFIAKNGDDIKFKTNATDTTNAYQVSGSVSSEKIKDFNKISNHYTDVTTRILNDYNHKVKTLGQPQAPAFAASLKAFKKNQADYAEATLKFMNDNKSSLAGYYASTSLDPVAYEKQLLEYADQIKGDFTDNASVQQFKKRMDAARPVSLGHKAPDFALMDIDSKPVKLADYKGKYIMLDFWASWCVPCRLENPNVVKLYAKFKDKGLNILGISLDEKKDAWQKAINADHLTWRHASEFKNFESTVVKSYHVESIPSNFIIDPEGNIAAKNLQGTELEDFFNKTFNKSE